MVNDGAKKCSIKTFSTFCELKINNKAPLKNKRKT